MWRVISVFIMFVFGGITAAAAEQPDMVADMIAGEAMRLGERMYREGILPSGEPMQAIVQEDVPVEGTMFTCASCHMRSGLGSVEGTVITPPTNGKKLYAARPKAGRGGEDRERLPRWFQIGDKRPAYSDETLKQALWSGVDSAGRRLDPIMPRYMLSERDMTVMVHYLKNLSVEYSPGVTEDTIFFATVVTDEAGKEEQEALTAPLRAYMRDRSTRSKYYESRTRVGPYAEKMDVSSRRLELIVWELRGDSSTWRAQLDAYYDKKPVFALLGGTAKNGWELVHRFCEERRIPAILPVTDFPIVSDTDWYTLYISKGFSQEAESVVRYLRSLDQGPPEPLVVQIFRSDRAGRALSAALKDSQERLGRTQPVDVMLGPGEPVNRSFWEKLLKQYPKSVIVAWLGPEAIAGLGELADLPEKPAMVFISSSMLGDTLYSLPEATRSFTYITYPRRLPAERKKQYSVVQQWLTVKKIPVRNIEAQSQMYFLGWLLTDALMMMGTDYYRDYFLDVIDMMRDQTYMVALYPRLSFGQGQRYASKGCYIVQLTGGNRPELLKRSEWVAY